MSCVLRRDIQEGRQIVAIAKHLCGVGTDLALKSLEPIKEHLHSCLLLTCCHGVCNWQGYVGRDYLHSVMTIGSEAQFGKREFDLLCKWSAGTCFSSEQGQQEAGAEHLCQSQHDEADKKLGITKVVRALILAEAPSLTEGEVTAKGNLNFRKILTRRADLLERLYDANSPNVVSL